MSTYSFLRWLRAGAAGAISETQQAGRAGLRPTFDVTIDVRASRVYSATKALHLYGPGDVVGIDPRQVVRRFPEPGTATASTQFFAHVELDAPDLPWRFTPFAEASGPDAPGFGLKAAGSLTPWLCLIVVERRSGVELTYTRGDLLPVLSVDDPARELPDPAGAHAWAHVQLAGAPADRSQAGLGGWIQGNPQRTLARLVCPRLLAPETAYIACLVPVFALGAKAGTGERLTGDPAKDPAASAYAWTATTGPVRLPVYDSWEFVTGVAGGFEDLVRRLERQEDLGSVGARTLDVSAPGWDLAEDPARPAATLLGALRPTRAVPPWPGDPALVTALADAIDEVRKVAPPIYGRWHAARVAVPRGGASPVWLGELNLDPGLRVAAALGTQVVQANQETYIAAAWAQVGDILRANQLLRQAQAAVAASQRLHRRHVAVLDPFATLALAGPALPRLRTAPEAATTVWGRLAATCLHPVVFSGPARRILRTRGPLGRRIARLRDDQDFDPAEVLTLLAGGAHPTTPPALTPLPAADASVLAAALRARAAGFGAAGAELAGRLEALEARAPTPCSPADDVGPLAVAVGAGIDPAVTVPRRARAQLSLALGTWDPPGRIDPIMVAPEITTPLFEALRALDPDWVLPGLDEMPPNSVGAVAVNQRFVEAFLVGANHEMGRELLWRGFPTDQRGSVFRVFWDRRGSARPDGRDITRVHEWLGGEQLGTHDPERPPGGTIDRFVLLLRGDLLARFPRTSIFCVRAEWGVRDDGSPYRRPLPITGRNVALPVFGGRFDPDVAFSGFDFDIDEARGDRPPVRQGAPARAGWFVVFEEQPTEPRFGIAGEAGVPAGDPLRSWRDLGTPLVHTAGGRTAGTPPRPVGYLDLAVTTQDSAFQAAVGALKPAWDGRADSLAAILLASPFRLYLHATDLAGEPEVRP